MIVKTSLLFSVLMTTSLHAQNQGSENQTTTGHQFQIDKNVVDKIYTESLQEVDRTSRSFSSEIDLTPRYGVANFDQLVLANDYFTIDYAQILSNVNLTSFSLANSFLQGRWVNLFGQTSFGYAFQQGSYEVESQNGSVVEDNISFQWVPIQASLRLGFPVIKYIEPNLTAGLGTNWFHQDGALDGMNQDFWVPSYHAAASLTVLRGMSDQLGSFGGITIQSLFMKSESSAFASWYHNIGTKILL